MIIRSQWHHDIHMYKGRWLGRTQPTRIIDRWTSIYPETFESLFYVHMLHRLKQRRQIPMMEQRWARLRSRTSDKFHSDFMAFHNTKQHLYPTASQPVGPQLRWDVSKPTTCWKFRHAIWLVSIIRFANQIQRSHHSSKSTSSDILPFNRNPRAQ